MSEGRRRKTLKRIRCLKQALDLCAELAGGDAGEWAAKQAVVTGNYLERLLRLLVADPNQWAEWLFRTRPTDAETALRQDIGIAWASHLDRLSPVWAWARPDVMARPHEVAVVAARAAILAAFYSAAWQRVGGHDVEGLRALGRGACEAFYQWQQRTEAEVIRTAERAAQAGGTPEETKG